MPNTPLPPAPAHRDTALALRQLALALMDAADHYDAGRGEEGERAAAKVAQQIGVLVKPHAS